MFKGANAFVISSDFKFSLLFSSVDSWMRLTCGSFIVFVRMGSFERRIESSDEEMEVVKASDTFSMFFTPAVFAFVGLVVVVAVVAIAIMEAIFGGRATLFISELDKELREEGKKLLWEFCGMFDFVFWLKAFVKEALAVLAVVFARFAAVWAFCKSVSFFFGLIAFYDFKLFYL